MSESLRTIIGREKRRFFLATEREAKYVVIGRDFIPEFVRLEQSACDAFPQVAVAKEVFLLGMKVVVAPWTTGITILPDVFTCESYVNVFDDKWSLPESEHKAEIADADPHFGLDQHPISKDYGIGYWVDLNDTQD